MRSNCVIADTNILIYSVRKKANLTVEISRIPDLGKLLLPGSVIAELGGLSRANVDARVALKVFSSTDTVTSTRDGDEGVLEAAMANGCSILSNDGELIARAKSLGIRTYGMRSSGAVEAV